MKMLFDFRKRKMLRRDFHKHLSIKNDVIQTDVHAICKTNENQSSKIGPFSVPKIETSHAFFCRFAKDLFWFTKKRNPCFENLFIKHRLKAYKIDTTKIENVSFMKKVKCRKSIHNRTKERKNRT